MKMAAAKYPDVPLVSADASLLSCWEEKVKLGVDCSLVLKHSKGKVVTILKCSSAIAKRPPTSSSSPAASSTTSPQAEEKKKKENKGGRKKKLEAMLSYQKRLVVEKGLPPSRLMLEHAALAESLPPNNCSVFKCDQCEFTYASKCGVNVHIGHAHKESQKPEDLREIEPDQSLDLSQASGFREEITSSNAEEEDSDVDEEAERISSEMEATNRCHFCNYRAPVPWVHPSKGTNLSGRDIWDHVWAEHPRESERFA